jgi:rhodanese-related sulfurtransferase
MRVFTRMQKIDAVGAADLIEARSVAVIDVRQNAEWKRGHIPGATHIPLTQLSRRLDEVPQGTTIVTVCKAGHRSALAARTLTRHGHDVLNLRGGMNAWARAGLPLTPRDMRT